MLIYIDLFRTNLHNFPPELVDILLPSQWNYIAHQVTEATREAHGFACCGEIICCIIFLFPFIFLCHPCIAEPLRLIRIDDRLIDVNRDLFSGQSVVRRQGNSLVINTDMLNMASQYAQSQNIVVATVSPVHLSPTETQANIIIVPVDSTVLRRTESNVPVVTAKMVD